MTSAVTGFQADGTDVYDDVTVTAFTLRNMSATVLCEGDFAPELTDIYAVMKDGSKIPLNSSAGVVGVQYLTPEKKIDLEQVDHILLADGGKLFALR